MNENAWDSLQSHLNTHPDQRAAVDRYVAQQYNQRWKHILSLVIILSLFFLLMGFVIGTSLHH